MEEDIKILEEFINNYKAVQEKYKDDEIQAEIERSCYFEEVPAQAIENLIKGYKIEKLRNTLDEQSLKEALENYISKSKAKEKIEELKKELTNEITKNDGFAEYREYAIDILEELMED
jgi:hypothetical protein